MEKGYYGYVYLTMDMQNGKVYIGQKKGKVEDSQNYFGSGVIIRKIIKKRGTSDLQKLILELCYSKEELTERETFYKYKYNAFDRLYGYNIAIKDTGGDTWKYSTEESREKRRIASRSSTPNKKHTEEWKINHSNKLKGRKHSEETKRKQSEGLRGKSIGKGVRKSEKHKRAVSKTKIEKKLSRGSNNPRYIKINYEFLIKEYFTGIPQKDLVKKYNITFNANICEEGSYKKFLQTLEFPVNTFSKCFPDKVKIYIDFISKNKDKIQWYIDNYERLEEIYYDKRCEGKIA